MSFWLFIITVVYGGVNHSHGFDDMPQPLAGTNTYQLRMPGAIPTMVRLFAIALAVYRGYFSEEVIDNDSHRMTITFARHSNWTQRKKCSLPNSGWRGQQNELIT